ncbi:hypothetical protein FB45DRAFT_1084769 [Roridomyces roridus]|uniref:Xylanolytic transcriptional activator regulatory domain-containing protein n=1 Tax=Roridomyces roridus TaxID=1738132 RepID=A0AAD7BN76_9AGAR|nr:hypothetical protein FB45DRAFT_1084769 [Roridomyces roridus]
MEALTRRFKHSFLGSDSTLNLVQNTIKRQIFGSAVADDAAIEKGFRYWEQEFFAPRTAYFFPPDDLIVHLMDLYFINIHPILPVLNRAFLKPGGGQAVPHRSTSGSRALGCFGGCFEDDPRVMIAGNTLSCGRRFVSQMRIVPNLSEPTVYDAQFYALMTLFCLGGVAPHITWMYLGLGARVIQYHGRFPRRSGIPDVEEELWNRAFWSILLLDGHLSAFLGRTPTIHAEEYDVPPPLEVDDEYWESGFVQPAGKPSALSFCVYFVRLFETMPVRWPNASGIFFDQSAMLQVTYHTLRITIHRLYINKQSPATGPSLFICVTAARSALNVAEIWTYRTQRVPSTWFFQFPIFVSAIILLLNVFATKRSPGSSRRVDHDKDLAQVQTALRIVRSTEGR